MKPSKYLSRIIMLLLFLAAVAYFGVYAYRTFYGSYETATVYEYTGESTLPAEGWLIRREEVLPTGGNLEEIVVAEGENVAAGDVVARVYSTQEALERHRELDRLETELERLNYIHTRGAEESDAMRLGDEIVSSMTTLRYSASRNDLAQLGDQLDGLQELVFRRDYTYSTSSALSEQIAALNNQIVELQTATQSATSTVCSPAAGIFSSTVDGYEAALTFDLLADVTPESLREAAGRRSAASGQELGKIITSFDWYFAAIMDQSVTKRLSTGSSANLFLEGASGAQKMTVSYISPPNADGQVVIVFHSNKNLSAITQLREQNINVSYGSYTGLRIPARALRADQETGQLGVYRLSGTQAEWVPVELVYSGSDYYLIRSEHEGELSQLGQAKELRPGDQVLVRGKDIYDGKVIE